MPAEAARQLPTRGFGRVNWQSALALFIGVREEPTAKGMNKDKVVAATSRKRCKATLPRTQARARNATLYL